VSVRQKLIASVRAYLARRGIVLGRIPLSNRLDHALVRVLSTHHVDYVLDVGAHTGEFARFLRRQCGWTGPICSFEPVHSNFVELTRAMEHDDAWHGYEMALGPKVQDAVIRHFPRASYLDSLLPASEYGRHRFPALDSPFSSEQVVVQRLDEVIDDLLTLARGEAVFLKIDAQGFDLDILRGATECLHRIVAIQLELAAVQVYEKVPRLGIAIEEVMELGYDPIGFYPVFRDEELRVGEFDGLFVRAS
jgi:FkbM family methyltransferase